MMRLRDRPPNQAQEAYELYTAVGHLTGVLIAAKLGQPVDFDKEVNGAKALLQRYAWDADDAELRPT